MNDKELELIDEMIDQTNRSLTGAKRDLQFYSKHNFNTKSTEESIKKYEDRINTLNNIRSTIVAYYESFKN